MSTPAFQHLLESAYRAHSRVQGIAEFCDFPTDLQTADYAPFETPSVELMRNDPIWLDGQVDSLAHAFLGAAGDAQWNRTYSDTNIGADFLNRFGNFCLIGTGGPWISKTMAAYVVYMPPDLYYPWHHHPAEEIYYVLAGEAEFMREGERTRLHQTGDVVFHATNQPHAARTLEKGMLAYVLWRNHLDEAPELTNRDVRVGG